MIKIELSNEQVKIVIATLNLEKAELLKHVYENQNILNALLKSKSTKKQQFENLIEYKLKHYDENLTEIDNILDKLETKLDSKILSLEDYLFDDK